MAPDTLSVTPSLPRVLGTYGGIGHGPLLICLGGIHGNEPAGHSLLVNRHIARWFVIEVFHLLGFRRQHVEANVLVVSRRPHDVFSLTEW